MLYNQVNKCLLIEGFCMLNKRKILIVDDNIINIEILKKILEQDYTFYQALNGAQALDIINKDHEISAVLIDLVMPIMNGYEFLENKNKDINIKDIPVIVVTQTNNDETEAKALDYGALDFLTKPYNPRVIKKRLSNLINLNEQKKIISNVILDDLTGVYDKEYFYHLMKKTSFSNQSDKGRLLCFDIERFKLVNDLFGVNEGDKLLKFLGNILKTGVQEYGIVGRLAADTFVVLIPSDFDYQKNIINVIEEKFKKYALSFQIIVKCGIYDIEDQKMQSSLMCDRAKLACNSIKVKYGVNVTKYNESLRSSLIEEQRLVDNMLNALKTNQFEVYYQPKFDLGSEKIAGAEALVRWNHPENGFLAPSYFIPLFEKNGFIIDLDLFVWKTVCCQIGEWIKNGKKIVPISVNVSRADIYNPNLVQIFVDLLAEYKLSPSYLHLEITETAYAENPKQLINVVKKLKEIGFIIEMDDFGSGYSSLNMLSELPIDVLKLDMGFIQNGHLRNGGNNIISFIISLAKWLGLLVVAEGAETFDQIQMLRNMDCNYAQGYYFSKPLKLENFEKLMFENEILDIKTQKSQRSKIYDYNEKKSVKINNFELRKNMLIVDDVEMNRAILVEIFKNEYNTIEAENGAIALEYLMKHNSNIDIILLDLVMPVMDGFQMLKLVKENRFLKDIPIVVTSQAGNEFEAKALLAGANDFISKPYHRDVVIKRISNVVSANEMKKNQVQVVDAKSQTVRKLFDTIPGGIGIIGINKDTFKYRNVYYNDGVLKMLGYTREEFEHCNLDDENFIYKEDIEKLRESFKDSIENNKMLKVTYRLKRKNGSQIWINLGGVKIREEKDEYIFHCIFVDIDEEYRIKETLKSRAERDPLTGCYNRMEFEDKVNEHITKGIDDIPKGTFIMIDLDNFKLVNDYFGHLKGDEALKRISSILEEFFRPQDIIARMGGDEFAIFIKDKLPIENLNKRLDDLCQKTVISFEDHNLKFELSLSIGVCVTSEKTKTYQALYRNSDNALLMSKRLGKKRYQIFDETTELPKLDFSKTR